MIEVTLHKTLNARTVPDVGVRGTKSIRACYISQQAVVWRRATLESAGHLAAATSLKLWEGDTCTILGSVLDESTGELVVRLIGETKTVARITPDHEQTVYELACADAVIDMVDEHIAKGWRLLKGDEKE